MHWDQASSRLRGRGAALVSACLTASLLAAAAFAQPGPGRATLPRHPVMTYHESWWERAGATGRDLALAKIPLSVDVVALAFAKPDLVYAGDLELRATGLEYRAHGRVVRDAIAALRRNNPRIRVLLSVGGAAYTGWDRLDEHAVARLVRDLAVDGVDIDFEPPKPGCVPGPACASDGQWRDYVRRLRQVLPRPALLSVSAWSVGAYGQGRWTDSLPPSPWFGSMVNLLRSPEAGLLDMVSVAAYGAGPRYQPVEAFAAYRSLWPGPLLLGIEGPPATGGGPPATATTASNMARQVGTDSLGGLMIYSWLGKPAGDGPPAGEALAASACRVFRRNC